MINGLVPNLHTYSAYKQWTEQALLLALLLGCLLIVSVCFCAVLQWTRQALLLALLLGGLVARVRQPLHRVGELGLHHLAVILAHLVTSAGWGHHPDTSNESP